VLLLWLVSLVGGALAGAISRLNFRWFPSGGGLLGALVAVRQLVRPGGGILVGGTSLRTYLYANRTGGILVGGTSVVTIHYGDAATIGYGGILVGGTSTNAQGVNCASGCPGAFISNHLNVVRGVNSFTATRGSGSSRDWQGLDPALNKTVDFTLCSAGLDDAVILGLNAACVQSASITYNSCSPLQITAVDHVTGTVACSQRGQTFTWVLTNA
jgi:hypothetical protein